MAKRFTDTDKWKKPFIRGLEAPLKLLWFYILDDCDHAGIWQVDKEIAEIKIGIKIDLDFAIKQFANHIYVFDDGCKWYIPDFIEFQYGELNEQNRVHKSILDIHKRYKIKPLKHPINGVKDKDKDKDMDKEKSEFEKKVDAYIEMRKKIKKPITDEGLKLMYSHLEKLAPNNIETQIKILEQSIFNSWQGLFPLKPETQIQLGKPSGYLPENIKY